MAARYYNAIVITDYEAKIKYRDITTLKEFLGYVEKNISYRVVMIYCKKNRQDKSGDYCGYYTKKKGLVLF